MVFFCFKQKTAYELRISDWSSDVCSSDLLDLLEVMGDEHQTDARTAELGHQGEEAVDLVVGERRRRLVEDEDPCVKAQCLGDLHELLSGDAERRSEERRVGKEGGSTCRYRGSRDH